MMFQGFNEQLFKERVVKKYALTKKHSKIFMIVLVAILLILATSLLYINIMAISTKSDTYMLISAIPKYVSLLILPTLVFWSLSNASLRNNKKMMHLYDHPDQYIFYPDFHMEVHSENKDIIKVQTISTITLHRDNYNNSGDIFVIQGKIWKNEKRTSQLILPTYLKDIQTIILLLTFYKDQSDIISFKNTTMKKILQSQAPDRNQYFVEELLQSQFLLPIRLSDEYTHVNIVSIMENVWAECATDQNQNICVYTSREEIEDEINDAFHSYKLIAFPEICAMLEGTKSFVFHESKRGLIINPMSDQVTLDNEQLVKIKKMGELQHGNYRD